MHDPLEKEPQPKNIVRGHSHSQLTLIKICLLFVPYPLLYAMVSRDTLLIFFYAPLMSTLTYEKLQLWTENIAQTDVCSVITKFQ